MRSLQYSFSLAVLGVSLMTSTTSHGQAANDPSYSGSSYNEILNVLEDQGWVAQSNEEQKEFDVYRSGLLPQYKVNYFSLGGLLFSHLADRSKKTLSDRADYYDRLQKFVHANGICAVGKWEISRSTPYSGFFKNGASGYFVGRISVALEQTTHAGRRGFGFAGKIFPTLDPNEVVPTTNFFTVDELSGTAAARFLDQAVTNEPPLIPSFDLAGVLAKIIPAFMAADSSPTFRPVTQIARTHAASTVTSPIWMRLRAASSTIKNNQDDFRSEIFRPCKIMGA